MTASERILVLPSTKTARSQSERSSVVSLQVHMGGIWRDIAFRLYQPKLRIDEREHFAVICQQSRALCRILLQPSLKLLPQFIDTIAQTISRCPPSQKKKDTHKSAETGIKCLNHMLHSRARLLSPDISCEAATYFASVARRHAWFYPTLKELLLFAARNTPWTTKLEKQYLCTAFAKLSYGSSTTCGFLLRNMSQAFRLTAGKNSVYYGRYGKN
ncbi:hypothetical protein M427DRAFT_59771 [Gonapodya prolifera JEL478]|uniref:Uncharacterized protein n=1 Tax=Gonapodya prolifera (strain JEL478) TaxID=1344416 RepID=A0A139A5Z5_GONPJ|nr:hypothetical protein M427DRAFT_59771 [Gonapodya prolifera JEL478]|eukprot:KXS12088.1 hypothetical protein M427DRAFT_59771 [Gonapodya prolifera JEL478]